MHSMSLLVRNCARRAVARRSVALAVLFMLSIAGAAFSQPLAGTYTVGGAAPNYATLDAAITDLNARGVSAPVTFAVRTGTYTPPAAGYVLTNVATMSAVNTVTIRPDANAIVTFDGTLTVPIFNLSGCKYFIIDGWGGAGTLKRDMKIIQRSSGQVVRFIDGAQNNTIRNCNLISNATSSTTGLISISTSVGAGNSYNTIKSNTLGDSTAVLRTSSGIYMSGSTNRNTKNLIDDNDIINLGYSGGFIYGIYVSSNNDSLKITNNRIRVTNIANSPSVFPLYGIYYSNSSASYDTIAYNRIWDLKSQYTTATTYGMYFTTVGASPIAVHNNMIALNGDQNASVYGIYVGTSSTTTFTLDYNSIDINGLVATSSTSAAIYMSSSSNVTMRNNALRMTRPSTGSNICYVVYRGSTTGTFTSNYNVLYNSGVGTVTGYYSPTVYTTLGAWQTGTTRDANSRANDPRFLNIAGGDLHVSTTQRTPVESGGTPIAGNTLDIDGSTRNAATPDIGADEGTFLALLNNDMVADRFVLPLPSTSVRSNQLFSPTAVASNAGANTQVNVNVRYRILNASSVVVYSDVQTIASLGSGGSATLTFNQTGNQLGNTSLPAGTYTIELTTQLAGDQDVTSDVITGTVNVKDPLSGLYTINKLGSGVRNYTSFTAANSDLQFIGVSGAVTFEIANGTYDNTTETFPITLITAPGMSATNSVTFRPAAGASPILVGTSPASSAIFMLEGAKYYVFDGSNVLGGNSRNWTIRQLENTTSPTFWLRNDAYLNIIRNGVGLGSAQNSTKTSSSTGIGIVFIGVPTAATGNDSNLVLNCTIGDPNGIYRNNIGVGVYGTSAKPNTANRIVNCDILNFGSANTYGYGVVAYAEQLGTVVQGCDMHNTVAAPSTVTTLYGIYTDYSPGYPINSIFNANRIYKLTSAAANWTCYGIYHWVSTSTNTSVISNNMISLAETGDHTYYGIYFQSSSGVINFYNNSIYMGGASTGTRAVYGLYKSSSCTTNVRNNVFMSTRTGGTASNYGLYVSSTTGYASNNNVISFNTASNFYTAYYTSSLLTLGNYQTATGLDLASFGTAAPFVDPVNGDLHINPQPVYAGEGTAVIGLGVTTDYDNQARDATYPDMGADEGNFNGGGLRVISPNGGEKFAVDYQLNVNFTANRTIPVRVDFSTNSGASWTSGPTMTAVAGSNNISITTPNQVTTTARVRVMSTVNAWEGDSSDANFELVLPVFTILSPNGGESLVPTDTTQLKWTSQFAPPAMRLQLEYSTNAGSTWTPIDTNIYTSNLPATNSYNWIVPNAPTQQARVRIKVAGSSINDGSDANFTIQPKPSVVLTTPVGGTQLFVGDVESIRWTSVNTSQVKLEYSTDGGATWMDIVPNGLMLPAYLPGYPWTIPNTPSTTALVRITNVERPRFSDTTDSFVSILFPSVQVLLPNGGEKYEIGTPVTVNWTAQNAATLSLEYTADGVNWQTINPALPAASGTYTFSPSPLPTKLARVRLVDVDRPRVNDASDAAFEIREPRAVVVYTPTAGDYLVRNTTTLITWDAPNVNLINIQYSSNGGQTWTTIMSNVNAGEGSRTWSVPNQNTTQGKIRIVEAGGPASGESGLFTIGDPAPPTLRLVAPVGGERYRTGQNVPIRWTSSGVNTVSVFIDNGTGWQQVATGQPGIGQYNWTAPNQPGTTFRAKVESTLPTGLMDSSRAPFVVYKPTQPGLVILYPNGGENLTIGSTVNISWVATDITGAGTLEVSTNGLNGPWASIATVNDVASGSYSWTVPNVETQNAYVRISSGGFGDRSDTAFEISKKVQPQLHITRPDGGEIFISGTKEMITWDITDGVTGLKIEYRIGAGSWLPIADNVAMSLGRYEWTIPDFTSEQNSCLVRISDVANLSNQDISDSSFVMRPPIAGVGAIAGVSGMKIIGNYPNPFAEQTEIRWVQPVGGNAEVRLYETGGAMVRSYDAGRREAGEQAFAVRANNLPSGMYIYEIRVAQGIARGVMMVAR